ncbi:MAG: signal peptide peptidase SppA [Rhodothermales bacterium]|nr:signal peptide peptidase SppA [Rhodothermales bacterium]
MRFFTTLLASLAGTLLAFALAFFFGFLFLLALAASADTTPSVRSGSVLVVELSGAIPEQVSGDPFAQAIGGEPAYDLYGLTRAFEKAAADSRIEGVWLKLRGVTAPWATLQEIRHALGGVREAGKLVVASSDDFPMREVEYFVATAADSVFAAPESFFEFNGFYLEVLFYNQLLEKLDVEAQIVRAGTFKSAVEPFFRDDLSPENEEQLAALLASQNAVFLEAVGTRRGITPEAVRRFLDDEALITSDAAYAAGLLDGLRFEDEVEALFKSHLGLDPDDDLRTVSARSYVRVPDREAGLEVGSEEIAVVYAAGTIMPGESLSGVVGSETFNAAMEDAREDDDVRAVVLRINSPGGSASASEAMWREIALTSEAKPVIVSMGDYAASGGYWIATAADHLLADPTTITGSIGVFSLFFDLGEFFSGTLGITHDNVRTGPYADMFSGLRSLSEPERALLQRSTDETYARFLAKVAKSRGLSVAAVDSVGQGRVWTGQQALDLGLIDGLGTLHDAVAFAAAEAGLEEGDYRVRTLPVPKTFLDELNDALAVQAAAVWQRAALTSTEQALLRHARTLDDLLRMQGTVQARLPMQWRVR